MALTKIQAAGLTDDSIDETKLADNSIDSEHYNDGSIDNAHLADNAVGIDELSASGTASNTTFLRGDNSWVAVSSTPEGDVIKSTTNSNEADTKFLRADGDGTCSWQVPAYTTNTNTTYTAGTGLTLSGTEFSVATLALTTVQTAANQSAMLGLTTQEGDVVVRTDESKTYMKNSGTAGDMTDFTQLQAPGTVSSVNGLTGAVSLTGLATGGNSGANKVFWENEQTVTHDYTVTNSRNAGSFGPVTINDSVTVTVGAGETWTIV